MKVQFSHETTYTPEFNDNKKLVEDQQLLVKMKPMEMLDLLDLSDTLKGLGFEKGDVKDLNLEQMKTLVKQCGNYVPKYCVLERAENFTIKEVVTYPAFMALASELLFTLLNTSSPNAADAKN